MNDTAPITADRLRIVVDNSKPSIRPAGLKAKRRFAQIPLEWLGDPVWRRDMAPALRLYLVLQYATRRGKRAVRLTNEIAAEAGITRQHKPRYLRQLEARGLIKVVRDSNRNPQASLL